jgi:hypothetical protein
MTIAGWIMMITSVTSVTLLTIWCFWRVLTAPEPEEIAQPPETLGG